MPREARIDVEGYWYHIIARGQRRSDLFFDHRDKERYLRILDEALQRNHADLASFCLMDNHVHLLAYRRDRSLGTIFRQAHMRYASYFNRRHRKVGYVFQGRFKSYLVLSDAYLIALIRYIHLNPVVAGMVARPDQYAWSSDMFYRGSKKTGWIRLLRVPGLEGKTGVNAYEAMIDDRNVENPPVIGQFIGNESEKMGLERRKRGRVRWVRTDRRGHLPLKQRIHQLANDNGIGVNELSRPGRSRAVSGIRQRLMSKLYGEGYLPSDIAACFKRTYSAVLLAHARYKSLHK